MTNTIAVSLSPDNLSPSIHVCVTPVNTSPRIRAKPFLVAPACLCTNAVKIPPSERTAIGMMEYIVQCLNIPFFPLSDSLPFFVANIDISNVMLEYSPSSIV